MTFLLTFQPIPPNGNRKIVKQRTVPLFYKAFILTPHHLL